MIMDIVSGIFVLVFLYEFFMAIALTSQAFWKAIAMVSVKDASYKVRFLWGEWSIHFMAISATWLICRHLLKLF